MYVNMYVCTDVLLAKFLGLFQLEKTRRLCGKCWGKLNLFPKCKIQWKTPIVKSLWFHVVPKYLEMSRPRPPSISKFVLSILGGGDCPRFGQRFFLPNCGLSLSVAAERRQRPLTCNEIIVPGKPPPFPSSFTWIAEQSSRRRTIYKIVNDTNN